jgi:hypothetical protein
VSRAKKATLQLLEPFLGEVRGLGIPNLVEKANGAFYQRRNGILHFHEDATGIQADVKVDGDWQRVEAVETAAGKRAVLNLLRRAYL